MSAVGVCRGVCFVLYLLSAAYCAPDALERVNKRFKATDVLDALSGTIEEGYRLKGTAARDCACAHHACSNALDPHELCTDRLGSTDTCGRDCTTRKVSLEEGFVTTPPGANPQQLSPLVVEDSCVYQTLNGAFKKYESTIYSWIYFGTSAGVTITYPGVPSARGLTEGSSDEHFGFCEQYDPRLRPWYLDATSGPKDLIILLDASSSMGLPVGEESSLMRLDLAKEVAKIVIEMAYFADVLHLKRLTTSDSDARRESDFLEANESNKAQLKQQVDRTKAAGDKDTEAGMKSAFQIFRRAQREEIRSTGCQPIILWITDGHLCNPDGSGRCEGDSEKLQSVLELLDKEQATLEQSRSGSKVSVFAMTVGDDADTRLAKQLACAHNGVWMHFRHDRDLVEQLVPYTSFFAGQLRENERRIIWSRFYEDFSGLGLMTTATRPMFSHGAMGSTRGKLLGVIGFDIPLNTLEENGLRYSDVVGQLSQHIGQCAVYPIDKCQLQILRGNEGECPMQLEESECYEDARTGRVYYTSHRSGNRWTFEGARTACESMNGRLAEMRNKDDPALFSSFVSLGGSWIALKISSSDQEWRWLSGKNRKVQNGTDFWSKPAQATNTDVPLCAAVDSRGTHFNVEARDCGETLDYVCEFNSAREATVCQGQIITVRHQGSNEMPSLDHCLSKLDTISEDSMMDSVDFLNLRMIENSAPVFCPMQLGAPMDNADALCCGICKEQLEFLSNLTQPVEQNSEEELDHDISSAHPLDVSILLVSLYISVFLILG